jgi:hypothetical protein
MKDADPLEGESTKRSLMGAAAFAVALVEGPRPRRTRGLAHPFDESLALEGGARKAPVDPALVATPHGDGCDAHVLLEGGSVGNRSRRSPKATSRRGARAEPEPGRESKSA